MYAARRSRKHVKLYRAKQSLAIECHTIQLPQFRDCMTYSAYSTLSSAYRFEPIAVENLGVFSSTTLNFISELGRRICVHTGDARETSYLFQRISIMLQRFNSVLLHDTLPVDLPDL